MRTDPLADRIRERRMAMSLSYRRLAALAGIHSPSFVFHIENGHKIPSEDVAARLARALGEDEDLYRAWSRVRRSGDLETSLSAARRLMREPVLSRATVESSGGFAFAGERTPNLAAAPSGSPGTRLKVAVVDAGQDPGEGLHPSCPVLGFVRIDGAQLPAPERMIRPYACRVTDRDARRVPGLTAGRLAVIARGFARPRADEAWAVRSPDGVRLSQVSWNERALLLRPAPGAEDFEVLEAEGEAGLRRRLVGWIAAQIDGEAIEAR